MINVGIVGMGRSGWELHAEPLKTIPGYKLVAVCDQSQARLDMAARTFGVRTCMDPLALIRDPQVDLVVIAAPSNLHAPLTLASLEAGKHTLVEKPMALTLQEADAMVAASVKAGRLLTVFHNRRWDRDYQMVKAVVRNGVLGDLLTLDSRVMTYGPEWTSYGVPEFNPQWRIQKAHGGGFLADWGPHLVEQLLDLTGQWPDTVTCQLRAQIWAKEVEDYFHMRLTFPSGLLATLEGSNNARTPLPRWFVSGREGTLVAEGSWGKWTDMQIRASVAGMPADLSPRGMGPSSGGQSYDVGDELSARFYGDLAEALTQRRPPAVTAARARNVMAILEAARHSDTEKRTVAVPASR
jgi:scyllo-inositol 2-dehydrogenase (NADP+)